jgi:hypothetical protein
MSDYDRDWMDTAQDQFENFWLDVVDYSNELNVLPSYIEEEFIINGELIKIDDSFPPNDKEFRYNPRPGIM